MIKICSKCKLGRDESLFNKRRDSETGRNAACKFCTRKRFNNWRKSDPVKIRENNFKARYGITTAEFEGILLKQSFLCAICRCPEDFDNSFCVDHSHHTGKVRGILCGKCNRGIGSLRDSYAILERAARYLRAASE